MKSYTYSPCLAWLNQIFSGQRPMKLTVEKLIKIVNLIKYVVENTFKILGTNMDILS